MTMYYLYLLLKKIFSRNYATKKNYDLGSNLYGIAYSNKHRLKMYTILFIPHTGTNKYNPNNCLYMFKRKHHLIQISEVKN